MNDFIRIISKENVFIMLEIEKIINYKKNIRNNNQNCVQLSLNEYYVKKYYLLKFINLYGFLS